MRRTILLGLALFCSGFATHALLSSKDADAAPQADSPYAMMDQYGRALVRIENSYVDPVDRARLVEGSIKGMIDELDPHSAYMPPQDYTIFQADTQGQFGGVGVEVDARTDSIIVLAPIEGSPAFRAGIKSGDRIIGVDGQPVVGSGIDKIVRKMRGPAGTHVKVIIRREGEKEPITFDLVREIVTVPSVTARLMKGGIAYMRIKQFQEKTHDEMLRSIGKLRGEAGKSPIVGIVLDLRNNPGGLVDQALEVADEFLTSGVVYTMRHRGQVIEEGKAKGGGAFADIPIVVMVNEWSASASELVAGALQDQKRGLIMGVRTFGKGSVQSILDLPGGAGMRLTIARYYTPDGHAIQADGVHPDVVVEPIKDPNALPPLRESDLPGALSAEGLAPNTDGGLVIQYVPPDGGPEDPLVAHGIPVDPTTSRDIVLKTAYETMRDKLVGHGPLVR